MAVANDTFSYMPPSHLRQFEKDISPLMAFLGNECDILVSSNKEYDSFRQWWISTGIHLPQRIAFDELDQLQQSSLQLVPWGWSKTIHRLLAPLKNQCNSSIHQLPTNTWTEQHRAFFSRSTSVDFLRKVKSQLPSNSFIKIPFDPQTFNTEEGLTVWMQQQAPPFVLKTPWSSSGRGLYCIPSEEFKTRGTTWIKSRLKQQGLLFAEPWLKKIQDLSFQYYIHSNGDIQFLGHNFFDADAEGRFSKEYLRGLTDEKLIKLNQYLPDDWSETCQELLSSTLSKCYYHQYYCGPIGIDAMVFQEEAGYCIHPCIEINFRHNMGYINLHIGEYLGEGSTGSWTIKQFKPGAWKQFAQIAMNRSPIFSENGKIKSGFLPLVPVSEHQLFAAWAEVTNT
jgi:hypothetical protein